MTAEGSVAPITAADATSETLCRAILEAALDCVVSVDEQGVVILWNAAAERTFLYAKAEAVGRPLADLIIPDSHREAHLAGFERHRATGKSVIFGRRLSMPARRSDGVEVPIELTIVATPQLGRRGLTAFLRDLSETLRADEEKRRADEKLRASEAAFRLLAECSPDIIARSTPQGRCLYVSPACRTILGYEPEELVGADLSRHIHPDDEAIGPSTFAAFKASDEPHTVVCRLRRKDGSFCWTEATSRPIVDPTTGDVVEIQSTARDISDRKRAEEALIFAKEQAEAASAEKSRFLSNVTHELRTPLNGVLGFVQVLEHGHYGPLTAKQRDCLAHIGRSGARMANIVDALLEFRQLNETAGDAAAKPASLCFAAAPEEIARGAGPRPPSER